MKNARLKYEKEELDSLFAKLNKLEAELQPHFSRYLCVLVSGFLENAVSLIFIDYIKRKKPSPDIQVYIENNLRWFQNPKMEKILELAGSFNQTWQENLSIATKGEIADSVNTLVNTRNSIAHGGTIGINPKTIASYYNKVLELIDLLEKELEKPK